MAKISIIVEDSAVYKDNVMMDNLDLSSCGIPANVYALQWDGSAGEVEYNGREENTSITELPAWANECVVVYDTAIEALGSEEEEEPEPIETFWADYPKASARAVNKILAKEYEGIVNEKALDPKKVLKGIETTLVAEGATALASLATLKNDCIAMGVPFMSDKMAEDVSPNFVTYLTDTIGYTLYTPTNRVYWPWTGDIVSNKADQDINDRREIEFEAGVVWDGKRWQIDLVGRNNIMNELTAIISGIHTDDNVVWRTMDNENVTLTIEQFKELATAVNNRVEEIYTASFNNKT